MRYEFLLIKMHKYTHTDLPTLKGYRGPKSRRSAQVHGASVGPKAFFRFRHKTVKSISKFSSQ